MRKKKRFELFRSVVREGLDDRALRMSVGFDQTGDNMVLVFSRAGNRGRGYQWSSGIMTSFFEHCLMILDVSSQRLQQWKMKKIMEESTLLNLIHPEKLVKQVEFLGKSGQDFVSGVR